MPSSEAFIIDKVQIQGFPTEPVWERGEAEDVSDNDETLVLSLTVTGSMMYLDGILVSGYPAEFGVYVNTIRKDTIRTTPTNLSPDLPYNNLPLSLGTVLEVRVTHYDVGRVHDFEASIRGHR